MNKKLLTAAAAGFFAIFLLPVKAQAETSTVWMTADSSGAVKVRWGVREDSATAHVQYGEVANGQTYFQHATSFGAKEGEGVIGGLQPGKTYAFRVREDNGGWRGAVVGTAQQGVRKTPGIGGVNQVKYSKAAKDNQVYYSEDWVSTEKVNGNGTVRLNYPTSDRQIHVRYTEAGENKYKFYTVAKGHEGGVEVGQLVEGRPYHFEVADAEWNWSRPMTVTAGGVGRVHQGMQPYHVGAQAYSVQAKAKAGHYAKAKVTKTKRPVKQARANKAAYTQSATRSAR